MSIPAVRRVMVDKAIGQLTVLPFVESAASDDFDTYSVDIFVRLKVVRYTHHGHPMRFIANMNMMKSQVLKCLDCEAALLDWPQRRVSSEPIYKEGYNHSHIKLEIYV